MFGQAKVYVRLFQNDLSLEEVGTKYDVVSETRCCFKGLADIGSVPGVSCVDGGVC